MKTVFPAVSESQLSGVSSTALARPNKERKTAAIFMAVVSREIMKDWRAAIQQC